jgi:hypothetical protein
MLAKSGSSKNSTELLLQYCKDIDEWPNRWEIDEADVIIGQAINEYFKLFLLEKIEQGRTKKTIRLTGNYLWALGGELIRQINYDETERKLSAKDLILKYVHEAGGPYWCHANNELDHAKYDSVCKQLFKFITENIN